MKILHCLFSAIAALLVVSGSTVAATTANHARLHAAAEPFEGLTETAFDAPLPKLDRAMPTRSARDRARARS